MKSEKENILQIIFNYSLWNPYVALFNQNVYSCDDLSHVLHFSIKINIFSHFAILHKDCTFLFYMLIYNLINLIWFQSYRSVLNKVMEFYKKIKIPFFLFFHFFPKEKFHVFPKTFLYSLSLLCTFDHPFFLSLFQTNTSFHMQLSTLVYLHPPNTFSIFVNDMFSIRFYRTCQVMSCMWTLV